MAKGPADALLFRAGDAAAIGTRAGWEARLRAAGFALRGHRLVRRNAPADT
jgi:hypothetical protein